MPLSSHVYLAQTSEVLKDSAPRHCPAGLMTSLARCANVVNPSNTKSTGKNDNSNNRNRNNKMHHGRPSSAACPMEGTIFVFVARYRHTGGTKLNMRKPQSGTAFRLPDLQTEVRLGGTYMGMYREFSGDLLRNIEEHKGR